MIAIHDLALEAFVCFVARLWLEIEVAGNRSGNRNRPAAPAVVPIRAVKQLTLRALISDAYVFSSKKEAGNFQYCTHYVQILYSWESGRNLLRFCFTRNFLCFILKLLHTLLNYSASYNCILLHDMVQWLHTPAPCVGYEVTSGVCKRGRWALAAAAAAALLCWFPRRCARYPHLCISMLIPRQTPLNQAHPRLSSILPRPSHPPGFRQPGNRHLSCNSRFSKGTRDLTRRS